MNSKQRVLATVAGEPTDRIPCGFWLHFPTGCGRGDAAVEKQLEYQKETESDFCKIMNENFLTQGFFINDASDWNQVRPFRKSDPFIQDQIELIKRMADCVGEDSFILATVFDATTNVSHILRNGNQYRRPHTLQVEHLRENPQGMKATIEAVTEIECYLAEECIKAGANGIYFAARDRQLYGYTEEEYLEYIKPANLAVLQAAKTGVNALHICGDGVLLQEFTDYKSTIVNWAMRGQNQSLSEGRKLFQDRVILGGFDNVKGVIYNGTVEEIREEIQQIVRAAGGQRLILGADCSLKDDIDYSRIRMVVEAAK